MHASATQIVNINLNDNTQITDSLCISLVDASFVPQQVYTGAPNIVGLGMHLKGRLQGIDFKLKLQAQAPHTSSVVEAEAQAILLAMQTYPNRRSLKHQSFQIIKRSSRPSTLQIQSSRHRHGG